MAHWLKFVKQSLRTDVLGWGGLVAAEYFSGVLRFQVWSPELTKKEGEESAPLPCGANHATNMVHLCVYFS